MSETLSAIVKTSKRLFGKYGLRKTTVDDIAKEAHVGKGPSIIILNQRKRFLSLLSKKKRTGCAGRYKSCGCGNLARKKNSGHTFSPG